jgi:hypothetical protein
MTCLYVCLIVYHFKFTIIGGTALLLQSLCYSLNDQGNETTNFLVSKMSRARLKPQPPTQWTWGGGFPSSGPNQSGHETDRPPPSNTHVRDPSSTTPLCLSGTMFKHSGKITFSFTTATLH